MFRELDPVSAAAAAATAGQGALTTMLQCGAAHGSEGAMLNNGSLCCGHQAG